MHSPTRAGAVVTVLGIAVLLALAHPVAAQSEQTYYDQDFSNKSWGEEVYQERFNIGKAGWSVARNQCNDCGFSEKYYIHDDSKLILYQETTDWSFWSYSRPARQRLERDISFPESSTYYFVVESTTFFESNNYGATIDGHKLSISGSEHTISDGRSLVSTDVGSGTNTIQVRANSRIEDSGPDEPREMRLTLSELTIINKEKDPERNWVARDFLVYVDEGIDGKSVQGRDFYGNINVSPAHTAEGPVILEFEIKTTDDSASWSADQLGTTVASGTVSPGTTRKIKQEVNLQSGDLRLDFSSNSQIAVDNIKVSGAAPGNASTGSNGLPQPSVGVLASASGDEGRNWSTGVASNLFDLAYIILQWVSIIALALGAVLVAFSRRRMRNQRGHNLLIGGVIGIVIIFGFPMGLQTMGWLATGDTDTASLDNPGLESTSEEFSEEFDDETFQQTGWEITDGSSGDVFLEDSGNNQQVVFQGSGATISKEITIERGESIPAANLKLDARINSKVGMQPPDKDGVNVTVLSGGDRVVDEKTVVTASGGDITEATGTKSFNLTARNVTIQITAADLNGDDGTVDIAVDDVNIQSVV